MTFKKGVSKRKKGYTRKAPTKQVPLPNCSGTRTANNVVVVAAESPAQSKKAAAVAAAGLISKFLPSSEFLCPPPANKKAAPSSSSIIATRLSKRLKTNIDTDMETNNTVSDPIVATLLYLETFDDANLRGEIVSLRKKLQSAVSASTEEAAVSLSATYGIAFSASQECKRLLEIDGTTGAKSDKKYQKREANRGIKKMHYWVREQTEALNGQKYRPPKLPKEEKITEMYHIHCCFELGIGRVAFRKIPCHCDACSMTLRMAWMPTVKDIDQPRFQSVPDCKYKNFLGNENRWFIAELEQRQPGDPGYAEYQDDDADLFRKEAREHITAVIANEIDVDRYGAVVTNDEDADGYYLVKWTSTPYYTDQESGQLVCDANYPNPVGRAPKWYTESDLSDKHVLQHVVLGDVMMKEISDINPLPNTCDKSQAKGKAALKVSKESDDFIFEEIHRRDALEDPEYEYEYEYVDDDAAEE